MAFHDHLFRILWIVSVISFFGNSVYTQEKSRGKLNDKQAKITLQDTTEVLALYEEGWRLKKVNPDSAQRHAEKALFIAEKLHFAKGMAMVYSLLGYLEKAKGEFLSSENYYMLCLEVRMQLGVPIYISNTYYNLGDLYSRQSNHGDALAAFQKALDYLAPNISGERFEKEEARILSRKGASYRHIGDFTNAIREMEECISIRIKLLESSKSVKDSINLAKANLNLANIYLDQNDKVHAERLYLLAKPIFIKYGSWKDKAIIFNNLGMIAHANKDLEKAERLIGQAIAGYELCKDSVGIASAMLNLGNIYLDQRKWDVSQSWTHRALDYFIQKGVKEGIAKAYHNLGLIEGGRNNYQQAIEYYHLALHNMDTVSSPFMLTDIYKELSNNYLYSNKFALASRFGKDAMRIQDSINGKLLEAVFLANELENARAEAEILKGKEATLKERLERRNTRNRLLLIILIVLFFLLVITSLALIQRRKLFRSEKEKNQAILNAEENANKIREVLSGQEYKLLVAMNDGQEEERKRIAEDLHDSLGALLASIKLHFQSIQDLIPKTSAKQEERIDRLKVLMEDAIQEVRKISHNLVSGVLWKFGLPPALRDLQETILSTGQVSFKVNTFGFKNSERLEFKLELTVYRMIQELVTNSLRHANASEIEVQATKNRDAINIMVIDNGVGFVYKSLDSGSGIGLKSIDARCSEMRGIMSIDSGRGNGTHISIDIPLEPQK